MLDTDGNVRCDRCGKALDIGEHPFCPHGFGNGVPFRDEIPGGITCENYGKDPITFYSHSERRAWMKAHGLNEKEHWAPFPGTDKDPMGIPNPAGYMDEVTRENARILLLRAAGCPVDDTSERMLGDTFEGVLEKKKAEQVVEGDVHAQSRLGRRIARGAHSGS
jgi:hypothetical protein